jgi:hypothetical protein
MRDPIATPSVPASVVKVAEAMLTGHSKVPEARSLLSVHARSGMSRRTVLSAVAWMSARDIVFRAGPDVRVLQPAHWLWWLARTNHTARLRND